MDMLKTVGRRYISLAKWALIGGVWFFAGCAFIGIQVGLGWVGR